MIFFTPESTPSPEPAAAPRRLPRAIARAALALAGCMCLALLAVAPGLADTGPTGATGPTGPAGPPGEPACLSHRVIVIHWRLSREIPTGRYSVTVNGEKYETLPASARKVTLRLAGYEGPETITVRITTRALAGETLTNTRHYHTCVPRMAHGSPDLNMTA
jgi:hypothetical protein